MKLLHKTFLCALIALVGCLIFVAAQGKQQKVCTQRLSMGHVTSSHRPVPVPIPAYRQTSLKCYKH